MVEKGSLMIGYQPLPHKNLKDWGATCKNVPYKRSFSELCCICSVENDIKKVNFV
jgi:hypothetical protein